MSSNAARSGALAPGSEFWRRLAYAGARHGPKAWLRLSPPVFGLAFALALPRARERVRQNLRRSVGPRARIPEGLDVCRTFMSYAGCLAEALGAERPDAAERACHFRDLRQKDLLAGQGGLIVATAHFGAWDAAAPLLARDFARPVIVAMEAEADRGARALHDGVRERAGVRVVHVGSHPLDALPLLHHLKDGGVVAVQLDRPSAGGRSVTVPFLDSKLEMPVGPFLLAALARVPLVPLFVRRVGFFDYELSAGPPLRVPPRPTDELLLARAAEAAQEIERAVRACPTQWFEFGV
ncbi:MAG: lysophospholipid acyltransferase family protein [Polyangiaceae bacterium]